MTAPRVLLVNQYFPPDTSATADLARRLVEALVEEGADVAVCAGRPSYRPSADIPFKSWRLSVRAGRVRRVRSTRFARTSSIGRLSNYFTYLALSAAPVLVGSRDVIVTMTDPPFTLLLTLPLARLRGVPVVYWLQDYHPEFLLGLGRVKASVVTSLWSRSHHWCMRRAAAVVVLGRDMERRVLDAGVKPDRVHVVPNGSAFGWPAEAQPPPTSERRDRMVVVHAGEIGMRGTWETLVQGARLLGEAASIVLVGDGVDADHVRALSRDLDNVAIYPPVPSAEVAAWLRSADLLLVMVRAGSEGYSVPSKTYELLGAGLPIVVLARAGAEPALLVTELECGVVVDPDDPAALAEAIRALAADPERRAALGARAAAASASFARGDMVRRVARIALGVVPQNPPRV